MSGQLATQAVVTRLRSIIGSNANVWDMLSDTTTEKAFKDRYVNAGKVHAWEVTREASNEIEGNQIAAVTVVETIVIYGYMSYQDGVSEPLFQAEVDAIGAAFRPPSARRFDDVPAVAGQIDWSGPLSIDGPKPGRLGQALIHYVRMTYPVNFYPVD